MSCVDVVFPVQGGSVPLDHGYQCFAALARRLPALHGLGELGIFHLEGRPRSGGRLDVSRGNLRLRGSTGNLALLFELAGAEVDVAGTRVRLGAPVARPLAPVPSLFARMVTIKNFTEIGPFTDAAYRQLEALGCKGELAVGRRRVVTVAKRKVVGFAVRVDHLEPGASLRLQAEGLGGRRHMGCGLFLP